MPNNPSPQDPKQIWQTQSTEQSLMTLESIRLKAIQLKSQTRRQLFSSTAIACFVLVLSCIAIWRVQDTGLRLIFAIAIIWALAGQYLLHRHMWPTIRPGDAANRTGLQFYRRAIEDRRYLSLRIVQWSVGPLVLCIVGILLSVGMIAAGSGTPVTRTLPFATLFLIWVIAVSVLNSKTQRELKQELEALDTFECNN